MVNTLDNGGEGGGYDQANKCSPASLNLYPNLFNIFIIQLLLFDKIC